MKILISSGHSKNGKDKGAIAHSGLYESELNYNIASIIKSEFEKYYNVFVDVIEEKDVNSNWQVNSNKIKDYDLSISIHHNAFNSEATGTEVLYKYYKNKQLSVDLSNNISNSLSIKNRGIKQNDELYMLNIGCDTLIEVCFIDNKNDYGDNYNDMKIAKEIINSIVNNYKLEPKEEIKEYIHKKTNILVNNELYEMNTILHKEKNYIELREFEKCGFDVEWDNENKLPILNTM